MRNLVLLGARLTAGGYVAAHGAQKLFGKFGGHGLEGTGGFFESLGLAPGRTMAAAAGVSELAGGVLTAAGLGHPIGPVAVASTMAVAAGTAHRGKGAFATEGGPELPLANLAAAFALAAAGPGRYSLDAALGLRVPRSLARIAFVAAMAAAAAMVTRVMLASPQEDRAAGTGAAAHSDSAVDLDLSGSTPEPQKETAPR